MSRTAVYHLFDACGGWVYIGMTNDPARRFVEHRRDSSWWPLVDESRTVIDWYATRAEAAAMEMSLITRHRPPGNTTIRGPLPEPADWRTCRLADWDAELARLNNLSDPVDQVRQITAAMAQLSTEQRVLRRRRQAAVMEMRESGLSLAGIGRELGLHRNRAQKIIEGPATGGKADEA